MLLVILSLLKDVDFVAAVVLVNVAVVALVVVNGHIILGCGLPLSFCGGKGVNNHFHAQPNFSVDFVVGLNFVVVGVVTISGGELG